MQLPSKGVPYMKKVGVCEWLGGIEGGGDVNKPNVQQRLLQFDDVRLESLLESPRFEQPVALLR